MSAARLQRAVADSGVWRDVRVVTTTASTNADLVAAARAGEPSGVVLIAEEQAKGRGRLDRSWQSPPRAGLLMSVLVRPEVTASAMPLLALLTGVALVETVRGVGRLDAMLKWPNDVIVGDRKLAGILIERVDDAVVIGVGLNVSTRASELPVETATSMTIEGGNTDRETLAKELLRALARRYLAFCDAGGGAETVLPAYRDVCVSIGRRVSLHLPEERQVTGLVTAVDDSGALVLRDDEGLETRWSAGDVVHLRAEA